jgi:large subunit ribosomal protein L24e
MYSLKRCSFCGREVGLGRGIMLVKNDGTNLWFCSSKCRKSYTVLRRDPRKLKWTRPYEGKEESKGKK